MGMKSFLNFLITELCGSTEAGTYIPVLPSAASAAELSKFVHDNIPDTSEEIVSPEEYHCTVIYSKKPLKNFDKSYLDRALPLQATANRWTLFNTCLVLEIESNNLTRLNRTITRVYGATSDYPTYRPHITVDQNYKGKLPSKLPGFNITFAGSDIKSLED